jgi:hypothetical protein
LPGAGAPKQQSGPTSLNQALNEKPAVSAGFFKSQTQWSSETFQHGQKVLENGRSSRSSQLVADRPAKGVLGHKTIAACIAGPEIAHNVIGENPLQKLWPITGGTRDIGVLVNQRPDGRPSDPSVDHLGDIGAGDHHGAIVGQAAA